MLSRITLVLNTRLILIFCNNALPQVKAITIMYFIFDTRKNPGISPKCFQATKINYCILLNVLSVQQHKTKLSLQKSFNTNKNQVDEYIGI